MNELCILCQFSKVKLLLLYKENDYFIVFWRGSVSSVSQVLKHFSMLNVLNNHKNVNW